MQRANGTVESISDDITRQLNICMHANSYEIDDAPTHHRISISVTIHDFVCRTNRPNRFAAGLGRR